MKFGPATAGKQATFSLQQGEEVFLCLKSETVFKAQLFGP